MPRRPPEDGDTLPKPAVSFRLTEQGRQCVLDLAQMLPGYSDRELIEWAARDLLEAVRKAGWFSARCPVKIEGKLSTKLVSVRFTDHGRETITELMAETGLTRRMVVERAVRQLHKKRLKAQAKSGPTAHP